MCVYPIYNHNRRNIGTIYIYITRLASKEIFSPSNKIHREVGRAKDLSAPRYVSLYVTPRPTNVDFVCTNLKIAVDTDRSSRFALPNCVSKFRSLSTVTSGIEVETIIQRKANHTLSLDQSRENFMQRNVKTSLFDVSY
jgi:hypothetical protein